MQLRIWCMLGIILVLMTAIWFVLLIVSPNFGLASAVNLITFLCLAPFSIVASINLICGRSQ